MVVGVYFITCGGLIPSGILFSATCEAELNCVIAVLTSAPGCKNTFITPTPYNDCDSICSTSFILAEYARSAIETIRFSTSLAGIPL